KRAGLVDLHQPAVTDHVGRNHRSKPAFGSGRNHSGSFAGEPSKSQGPTQDGGGQRLSCSAAAIGLVFVDFLLMETLPGPGAELRLGERKLELVDAAGDRLVTAGAEAGRHTAPGRGCPRGMPFRRRPAHARQTPCWNSWGSPELPERQPLPGQG